MAGTCHSIDDFDGAQIIRTTKDRLPFPRIGQGDRAHCLSHTVCLLEFDAILSRSEKPIPRVRSGTMWRRIRSAELTGESFVREPGFNIDQHAQKAFGAFPNDSEYGEVIWKFKPDVASHARAFLFTQLRSWRICLTAPYSCGLTLRAIWRCAGISIRGATKSKSLRLRSFEKWSSRTGDQIFGPYPK